MSTTTSDTASSTSPGITATYPNVTDGSVINNGGGVFGVNNLYQSVIIALVSGGVFSLAFLSIVIRRRRFREMQATLRDRQARLDAFMAAPRPSTGGPERDVGSQPIFWDVVVGGHAPRGDKGDVEEDDGSEESVSLKEKEKHAMEEEEDGDVDVEGQMRTGWIPTSLSLSHNSLLSSDHAGRISAEITVLISMPSEETPSLAPPITDRKASAAPVYESPLDEETLPAVQLASTVVNISSLNLAKRRELDRWMKDAEKRRTTTHRSSSGRIRIERVDGFRDPG